MNATQTPLAKAYGRLAHVPYSSAMVHDIMHGQLDRVRSDASKGRVTAGHVEQVRNVLTELRLIPAELKGPVDGLVSGLRSIALESSVRFLLAHHRIQSLRGTSDTLDERFQDIDDLLKKP